MTAQVSYPATLGGHGPPVAASKQPAADRCCIQPTVVEMVSPAPAITASENSAESCRRAWRKPARPRNAKGGCRARQREPGTPSAIAEKPAMTASGCSPRLAAGARAIADDVDRRRQRRQQADGRAADAPPARRWTAKPITASHLAGVDHKTPRHQPGARARQRT